MRLMEAVWGDEGADPAGVLILVGSSVWLLTH